MAVKLNPHVSVDCVIFGFDGQSLKVLLIDRNLGLTPEKQTAPNSLKLPGSMVYDDEDVDTAAVRVLKELTGLENIYLQQLKVFGSPDRLSKKDDLDWLQKATRMTINRVVTVAYYALIKLHKAMPCEGKVIWQDTQNIPELAFDHRDIVIEGLTALRKEVQYEPLVFELLPKKFTIRQLQTLYEIIEGRKFDNRNFRKSISRWQYLQPIDEKEKNVAHKPAQFYRFDKRAYQRLKKEFFE
ncbi:MAG TPA: NUDIX domain-containing protein [Bacteroidales bacterium]|nr:NUDIX domain-containing protein [Bacteroidales bacterium]